MTLLNDFTKNKRTRLNLLLNIDKNPYEYNISPKDPIFQLIFNYDELIFILDNKINNISKLLYFNKNNVHSILYISDKVLLIKPEWIKYNLSFYFYLNLLIKDNINIVNYSYYIDFIRNINQQNNNNNKKIQKFLISTIIIGFIDNYKQIDFYNKDENKELEIIKEENNKIIQDSVGELDIFLNKENKKLRNIDEIYIDIIIKLILEDKFDNYNYINDIVNQLDLQDIYLTELIKEKILNLINNNKDIINKYIILNIYDLCNIKKINFYYILTKYILKSSIYIYNLPLLLKTRKFIINLIKKDPSQILELDLSDEIKERIKYILKYILNSEYYYQKYLIYKLK